MNDPTAVLGRRAGAYVLDGIVALLLVPVVLLIGSYDFWETFDDPGSVAAAEAECEAFNDLDGRGSPGTDDLIDRGYANNSAICVPFDDQVLYIDVEDLLGAIVKFSILSLLLGLVNPVVIQGLTGASIGKHLVGLRVVREDGSIAAFGWHVVRHLLLIVEGNLIGIVLVFVTRGHRRLGDMAAGTYVVDRSSVGTPIVIPPPGGSYPPGYPPAGYAPPPAATPGVDPAPAPAPSAPPADEPQWSAERETYILYDRDAGTWLQWNGHDGQWGPIDQ